MPFTSGVWGGPRLCLSLLRERLRQRNPCLQVDAGDGKWFCQGHCCPRHWWQRRFPQRKHLIPRVSAAPPKSGLAGGRAMLSEAPTGHLTTTGGQETTPNGRFQAPKPPLTQTGKAPAANLPVQFEILPNPFWTTVIHATALLFAAIFLSAPIAAQQLTGSVAGNLGKNDPKTLLSKTASTKLSNWTDK